MKANELAIGDWVCVAGPVINGEERHTPPMRVVAIGETWVHLLIDPEAGDPDEEDIEDIRPISLTSDILMANGWSHARYGHYRYECVIDESTGETIRAAADKEGIMCIDIFRPKASIFLLTPYIHQLQHALRMAGIDKEIELL